MDILSNGRRKVTWECARAGEELHSYQYQVVFTRIILDRLRGALNEMLREEQAGF